MSLQTRLASLISSIGADIKELTDNQSWTVVTKTVDESVASNVTPQNDDELFFLTVADGVYEIEILIVYGSPLGGGTPDIKLVFGEDTTDRGIITQLATRTLSDNVNNISGILANQTATFTLGGAAINRQLRCFGLITGNGGTFRVKWSQNTSGVNPTIVRAGSVLKYRRIL